jgi:hypothetical protein
MGQSKRQKEDGAGGTNAPLGWVTGVTTAFWGTAKKKPRQPRKTVSMFSEAWTAITRAYSPFYRAITGPELDGWADELGANVAFAKIFLVD